MLCLHLVNFSSVDGKKHFSCASYVAYANFSTVKVLFWEMRCLFFLFIVENPCVASDSYAFFETYNFHIRVVKLGQTKTYSY